MKRIPSPPLPLLLVCTSIGKDGKRGEERRNHEDEKKKKEKKEAKVEKVEREAGWGEGAAPPVSFE